MTTSDLKPYRTIEGITEYRMSNGLKVLLFADDSQSTVTVNITYLVGSRHEGRGEAGMAHLLEHMLFKGTPMIPDTKGALQDRGAFFNATTWYDRTNYFETLPSTADNLDFALRFEADRMLHAMIRKEDLDAEMTVVRNEFEIGENDPIGVLHDQVMSAAFRWHNYGKSTIGNRSDIERVPVENLRAFYSRYYQPDNAVLIVAGKFDTKHALGAIETHFGHIPRPSRKLDPTYTEEPVQDGARRIKLLRSGEIATACLAYHIPSGSHKDNATVKILADMLVNEPSGHLYKTLVEGSGIASEVFGMTYALYEPGMVMLFAKAKDVKDGERLLDQMIVKTESERQGAISEQSLNRAKARMLKGYKLAMANSKDLALKLSESIAQGGFELFFMTRDRIRDVTLAEVEQAAQTYLIESNRTAGVFLPTSAPVRAHVPPRPDVDAMIADYKGSSDIAQGEVFEASAASIEKRVVRKELQGGIKVAFLEKKTRGDIVNASLIFRFGTEEKLLGHGEALELIGSMLMRGTQKRSYEDIQDTLDILQSNLSIGAHRGSTHIDITSDRTHLPEVIKLVAEMIKEPAFHASEFEIVREKEIADLEEAKSDPQRIGFHELERLTSPWPKSSIHYVPTLDEHIEKMKALSAADLKKLHQTFYSANNLELAIVGSFDAEAMQQILVSEFGSFHNAEPFKRITRPFKAATDKLEVLKTADKQMAVTAMAINLPIRDDSPDYPALRFANYVFGESMKSRIMLRLREKEGLSYSAGSSLSPNSHEPNSKITMYAMAATQNAQRALDLLNEELVRFIESGVTLEELADGKVSFKSRFDNLLANDRFVVRVLSGDIECGRTFQFHQGIVDAIAKLTPEAVLSALRKYAAPATIARVKAGDF